MTQEYLQSIYLYKDGFLISKETGEKKGTTGADGYVRFRVLGKRYKAHRLVFLYHHGFLPKALDHINRVKDDNRIENLRVIDNQKNAGNISTYVSNTSGYTGVSYHKRGKNYQVSMAVDGVKVYLGSAKTAKEAADIYRKTHTEWYGIYSSLQE